MVFKDFLISIFSNLYFLGFLSMVVAFFIAVRMFPVIIFTVRAKNLMDEPEDRSMHTIKTPTLGGVGLFVAFSLTLMIFGMSAGLDQPDLIKLISLLAATLILLFLGVKDDLIAISPKKKFIGQIIASAVVIFSSDIRINSFHGLLGIGELPYAISVLFSILVFIFIINAFNLIDGIDGLAGAIAIIASATFGIFFLVNGNYLFALVSFVLVGALIGFLQYNLSKERKLFMGDSGSLFIGFLLAYQGMSFLVLNETATTLYTIPNAPIMVLAVLSFPILDTLRVFIVRIRKNQSPFTADRNHIHHRLLDIGLSHKEATTLVAIGNILIIELAFLFSDLYINVQLYIVFIVVPMLFLIPFIVVGAKGMGFKDLIGRFNELNNNKEVENKGTLQSNIQPSEVALEEGPSDHNDNPTISLPARAERLAKAKKSRFRRSIAKGLVEVRKLTALH